jgi:hypothetical protein
MRCTILECTKKGESGLETTRDNDGTHLIWFEVQVKGVELRGDETILLLEKCGDQAQYVCKSPIMLSWLKKHNSSCYIGKLAKSFIYARIGISSIIQMKIFEQSIVTEETIPPQDWDAYGTPTTFRSHAPFRERESGGMQKCPNCGADTETSIVRTGVRIYHKCLKCCALMETVGGRPFS